MESFGQLMLELPREMSASSGKVIEQETRPIPIKSQKKENSVEVSRIMIRCRILKKRREKKKTKEK